ncbi:TonB-dependent receptor domain-containing protein [Paraglaciecola sp.]|uniref:TonB-dependent receptor domain-containing protein n=1 Tax=Paraglaciecola sp. TaxID=1920173 RepID=UPI00273EA606|nr:TonB-dependent receptor [Paraglaciecola sp.]MDP5031410.1 TonB-dependent receptor [Paraglaciecola sp.]
MKSSNPNLSWLNLVALSLIFMSIHYQANSAEISLEQPTERILVTGSRIMQLKDETASPVIVISSEDIKEKGFNSIYETLQSVSVATGYNLGQAVGGSARNAETINLRGLGPNRTLFLLNGKRVANYPRAFNGDYNVFNVASLPVSAVERIEIVTAASSSIYGSDAMAGVVNIITKQNIDETIIDSRISRSSKNDADHKRFSIVTGNTNTDSSWTLAIEYDKQEGLIGKQRDWLDDRFDTPADLAGQSEFRTSLPRALSVFQISEEETLVDPGREVCSQYENLTYTGFFVGNYCGRDGTGDNSLINDRENVSIYYSGEYDLSQDLTFSFDMLYWKSKVFRVGTRGWYSEELKDEVITSEYWEGDGVFIANDGFAYSLSREFQPEDLLGGEGAKEHFDEDVFNVSASVEGLLDNRYKYEIFVSSSLAKNKQTSFQLKKEIASDYFVKQNPINGELSFDIQNFWRPLELDDFNTIFGLDSSQSDSHVTTFGSTLTGAFIGFDNLPILFATFAEYEMSKYDLNEHPRTLGNVGQGWVGKTGTQGSGSRNRYAVGFEIDVPFTKFLSASLSARYDRFIDNTLVKGAPTYKLGLKWQPMQALLFRVSHGTTFRAPDLHNIYKGISGSTENYFDFVLADSCDAFNQGRIEDVLISQNNPDALSKACNQNIEFSGSYNIVNESSGNENLKEETGYSSSLGAVWQPTSATTISFDLYKLKIKDGVLPDSLDNFNYWDWECRAGFREQGSSQCQQVSTNIERNDSNNLDTLKIEKIRSSFINTTMEKMVGFDVSIDTSTNIANFAILRLASSYTHTLKHSFQMFSDELEGKNYRDSYFNSSFRSKINSTLSVEFDSFDFYITHIRYGSLPNSVDYGDWDQLEQKRYSPLNFYNLGINYEIDSQQNIKFGILNAFDSRARSDASEQNFPYFKSFSYPQNAIIIGRQFTLAYQVTI